MGNLELKNDILRIFKPIISSWNEPDIYAISFFVYNYDDNPCEPTVTLGYNTERQYKNEIKNASDKDEARWNYAFWLINSEFIYGENVTKEIVADWIKSNDLPYYPCFDTLYDDWDNANQELLNKIATEFINILIEIVKELHKTGFIQEKFGKSIPIIIHDFEYCDKIAEKNITANTLPLVSEFVEWIQSCAL